MRHSLLAFQLIGSLLAVCCLACIAVALGGCALSTEQSAAPTGMGPGDLLRSRLRAVASVAAIAIPLSPSEEEQIIARAIAEHEMRNP